MKKKFYVKQINFNSYITKLATRPGSPIGKVISQIKFCPLLIIDHIKSVFSNLANVYLC
jgi:hypothetical protein